MNYLAHAYLARHQGSAFRLGNLMADHIKGPAEYCLPYVASWSEKDQASVLAGINYHRRIDHSVDHWPQVVTLRRQFLPDYRRYAGIVLDMAWDYCLARYWSSFSELPLADFAQEEYRLLQSTGEFQPESMRRMVAYMVKHNWLLSYRDASGIERALKGLSSRFKRENKLDLAFSEIPRLETDLLAIFPSLMDHLKEQPIKNIED